MLDLVDVAMTIFHAKGSNSRVFMGPSKDAYIDLNPS